MLEVSRSMEFRDFDSHEVKVVLMLKSPKNVFLFLIFVFLLTIIVLTTTCPFMFRHISFPEIFNQSSSSEVRGCTYSDPQRSEAVLILSGPRMY